MTRRTPCSASHAGSTTGSALRVAEQIQQAFRADAVDLLDVRQASPDDLKRYSDHFVDGIGLLYEKVKALGVPVVGTWPKDPYRHNASAAQVSPCPGRNRVP